MVTLSLCGDVMTGRGIDQVLPHPAPPALHESYITDARDYVKLAERAGGRVRRPVAAAYVWGDALDAWARVRPDARIVNLETSITTCEDYWQAKEIHYRMNPANIDCLTAAGIDCCCLANNHVLDWGYDGLVDTLATLKHAGIATAGAGQNADEAAAPAVLDVPGGGRVLVFSFGSETSGIPRRWAATRDRAGVNLLDDMSEATVRRVGEAVARVKRERDVAVASIHWGGNWGYEVPAGQRQFAHGLIDAAGIDVVYGHSSHHVKGIEVYRGRLILYGCGDFLTDYEGISGHEAYRDDLGLLYFPRLAEATGKLASLEMTPTQIRQMRLRRPEPNDARWLCGVLGREGKRFGTGAALDAATGQLSLRWDQAAAEP